jgi:cobalt-zinc-cadmium efflux system outer membrane protein
MRTLGGPALALLVVGCAGPVSPRDRFADVQAEVAARGAALPQWSADDDERRAIDARVEELLSAPLESQSVVEIALLNNPALRAQYAQLGMAQADFVEAGLLANPRLSAGVGFPDRPPSGTEIDLGVTMNLVRLLVRPGRREVAAAQLEGAAMEAAHAALDAAFAAHDALLRLQAAHQTALALRDIAALEEAGAELAGRLAEAGNLSDLSLARQEAAYEEARVEYGRALAEVAELREGLNIALGLWGSRIDWTIDPQLPPLPAAEPDLAQLESLAIRQRLDLGAAAKEVEAIWRARGLQRSWRYILTSEVGFRAGLESDGQWTLGPEVSVELPIFDQRQAELGRLEAALAGAQDRLQAMAIQARADVRRLRDRLYTLRYETEQYEERILPLREQIVTLTQQEYNFMLADSFSLLRARREQAEAQGAWTRALREYWLTRLELERAVGGRLPPEGEPAPAGVEGEATEPQDEHEGHGADGPDQRRGHGDH